MLLYSIYLSPLFTNWGNMQYQSDGWTYGDENRWGPYLIKVTITVVSVLLYLWTIVAPRILTDREF